MSKVIRNSLLLLMMAWSSVMCRPAGAATNAFALTMHSIIVPEIHIVSPELKCRYQQPADPFAAGGDLVGVADVASSNQNSFAIHARKLTMLELVDLICFLSDNTYTFGDGGLMIAPTNRPTVQLKQNATRERALITKLKTMVVPECMFRYPATILDAMEYLVQLTRDFDVPAIPDDQRGVNFAVKNPYRLRHRPPAEDKTGVPIVESFPGPMCTLYDNLTNICERVNARFLVRDNTVVIY